MVGAVAKVYSGDYSEDYPLVGIYLERKRKSGSNAYYPDKFNRMIERSKLELCIPVNSFLARELSKT